VTYLLIRNTKAKLLLIECREAEVPYLWDMAWEKDATVQVVGGCEARRLIERGVDHATGLHLWPNGRAHRRPPPTMP
jgi:hypothetical protein